MIAKQAVLNPQAIDDLSRVTGFHFAACRPDCHGVFVSNLCGFDKKAVSHRTKRRS
jgi:hypothetical protein